MACYNDIRDEALLLHLDILKSKVNGYNLSRIKESLNAKLEDAIQRYRGSSIDYDDLNSFYEELSKKSGIAKEDLKGYPIESEQEPVGYKLQNMVILSKTDNLIGDEQSSDFIDDISIENELDLLKMFNNSPDLMQKFLSRFNNDMIDLALFSDEDGMPSFNNSSDSLNQNIANWKSSKSQEQLSEILKDYFSKNNSATVATKLSSGKPEDDFIYKAFVSLHFDKLIKLSPKGLIKITRNGYEPNIKTSLRTGWTDNEFINFFDEFGDFSKSIIQSRRMIGLDGKFTGNYLQANVMFNIMNRLYEFTDRTDPQYLDKAIAAILARRLNKSAKIDENYEKLVTNDFLSKFDDEDTEALLSFYIHFMNKGEGSKESNFLYQDNRLKNGSDWKGVHSFHNRSFNSFNSNSYKSSGSIDYYDLIKSGFEKCTSNRYSQVVYDYETRTFNSEDLNTNMSNKRKRILLNNANFIVNNLFLNNSAEFKKNEQFVDFLNQFGSDVTIDEFTQTGKFTIDGVQFNMNVEGQTGTYNIIESGDSPIKNNGENIKLLIKSLFGDKTTNVDDYFNFIKNKDNKSTQRKQYESILQALTKTMYCINNKINNQDKTINITDSKDSDSTTVDSQLGSFSRWIGNIAGDEVKAVTSTKDDNFLPSFGIINMAKDIRTQFNFIKKSIKRGKVFFKDNLIFKNIKAVGEPVTNTLISFNDKNVPVAKATGEEIFFNDFMLQFLQRISAGQPVLFQPTTYSDKTKQTAFSFDRDLLYTTKKLNVSNMTISQLSNSFAEQTKGYYDQVISKIKTDLKQILQLDDNYNTLSKIQSFIEENKIQESDIINKANQLGLKIVSTMYFEKGKINSLLSELETMNKGDYLSFFENDLNNSIDIMMDNDINIDYSNNKSIFESAIKKMQPKFIEGIDIKSFERLWVNKNTDRVIFRNSDGEINPLFKRYFYEHNLCCEPLNQMIIGGVQSHPAKAKGKITLLENFAKRYIAQTKRTVGVQATYHPYRLGQYNGVTYYERIAFVSDPSIMMFNQLGNRTPLETTDGSSMSNPLSTILKNNSLLDQGGQVHHKSIGMFVDPENGSFMLMKHADHTITNERIRNSRYSKYNYTRIIKKMLSYDFGDIDITKDFNGRDILSNLNVIYKKNAQKVQVSNIIKIDGLPNQYNIILKTTDSVTGVVTTEKKEKILIKNLFNLWNVLGADRSVHISDDGRMIYDDSSWNNLAEFVNKVGFYKSKSNSRTFDFVSKQYPNNPNAYEQFRADITKYRYDDDNNVEYENHRPTADSLYQPLKYAFVGQITFASGEKVGAVNVNPTNALENDEPFMTYDEHSSIYTGLQLDHEHHIDDSEVTFPTQIGTAIMFNGDAFQWNNQFSESMQNMIIANVSSYFESHQKYSELPKDEIRKIIGKHIINELSKKDLSNIATSFASKVQQDIEKLLNEANKKYASDKSAYNGYMEEAGQTSTSNVSFSDPGIYNVVVNSLNNLLTRLAIRNKIAGSMNVLSPCNDFMTIHDRDGKTYLASDFDGVLNYIPIKKQDVKIFDTIRITRKTKQIPQHSQDIKQQIDFLFERNKELNKIGTKEQYENYLLNVFPQSIDKDIYWHGSDSDFSQGFESAKRGAGSGAPEVGNEFYLAKQPWSVLQYVSGVNRKSGPDKNGFNHWNKLWWELKEIMSNGRRETNDWKDLIIDDKNVRQAIPNKKGLFDRDSGGKHGKWLSERKADYGYQDKTDKQFFKDIFGINYGKDTFNSWVARNEETFKDLAKTEKGMYPAIINTVNPIKESGQNTYYEEQRGLKTLAAKNNNDSILGQNTDNEFGSDVAVVFDPKNNIHFLGTNKDLKMFKDWIKNQVINSFESEVKNPFNPTNIDDNKRAKYAKDLKWTIDHLETPNIDEEGLANEITIVTSNGNRIPLSPKGSAGGDLSFKNFVGALYLLEQYLLENPKELYKFNITDSLLTQASKGVYGKEYDESKDPYSASDYSSWINKEQVPLSDTNKNQTYNGQFHQEELYIKDYDTFQKFRELEGEFEVEKVEGAGRRLFPHRVQYNVLIDDKTDIFDPKERVKLSKLLNKEEIFDVINSVDGGLAIGISLKNHPNFQAVLFFNDRGDKRNWKLQVQLREGVNLNSLSKEEQQFYNENSIISKEDVQKFLDRYVPKDMQDYLTSEQYNQDHIESVMFPSGKDINKTHIGVDNHLRDNWGIHFINEYTDESNYISRSIEKTKDTFSTDFIRLLNDVKLINDKTGEDKKNAIFQYLAALKLSSNFLLGNENSEIYKSIVNLVDEFSDKKIEFNENQFNFLKNLQLLAYKRLKENHQTLDSMYDYAIEHNLDINNVAMDVLNNKLTIDDFTQQISNYTELPAEVIMPANVAHNFMVKEGDVITDINEDFYKKRISNAIGNKVLDHKTLIDHNGKNITIITPEEFAALDKRGIKTSYKYLSENGKNYIVNKKYEKISQIGDLQFYDFKDGPYKRVAVLSNHSDMIYLQNFDDGVGRYGFIFDPAVDRDSQIEKQANIMNAAFQTSLYGSMCRIPSQSKQSGMPMKIVGFMQTENNVSFVPPENLYLTGGDFDIDKIVQVLLSFKRNGKPVLFNDYVDLMNHVSILTSLSLPLSDYKEREIVDEKYTGDDALQLSDNEISLLNSSIDKDGNPDISNLTPDDFKSFSLLMHKIKAFDKIKIARPEGWTPSFKNDIYDNAENAILTFFESGRKHLNDSEAMQAATVATLYHAYNDGRNAIHTYAPMEADKIKGVIDSITNISEEEKKAGITEEDKPKNWMKIYSPTNVLTDIMMQIANMTGKDGISRAATGQKALGVIHDRFLKIGKGKTENIFFNNTMPQEVAQAVGVSDQDVEFMTNGFNTYNMLDNINKFIQQNFAEDSVEQLIKKSYEAALQQSDSSLDMSSLITLSTDGTKKP